VCIARSRRSRRTRGRRWGHVARRTRWWRRACWARAGRRRRAGGAGRGTRKAWSFATPVLHIFRVLIEGLRTTLPRREVRAGIEQIARNVDLLALWGVGQTLRRRIGVGLHGDDDRRPDSAERQSKTAVGHENSSWWGCRNGRYSTCINERTNSWAQQDDTDSVGSHLYRSNRHRRNDPSRIVVAHRAGPGRVSSVGRASLL
jgi:hypothetical protein